jgi:hypothetical protein
MLAVLSVGCHWILHEVADHGLSLFLSTETLVLEISKITYIMTRTEGFTLLEVAIVILVIGLIVGGVMAGQELIKSAQIRSIASQYEEYKAATLTFKNKYNCIPGDCMNAAQFGLGTSGNGNGRIENNYAAAGYLEPYQFWQHLGRANLIKGEYSGTWSWADGLYFQVNGKNGPLVRNEDPALGFWVSNEAYAPAAGADLSGLPPERRGETLNIVIVRFSTVWAQAYAFPAWKAQLIDSKLDDGRPFTGVAYHAASWNCVWPGWPTNAYAVTVWPNGNLCSVKFVILQ